VTALSLGLDMPRYAFGRVTPGTQALSFATSRTVDEVLEIAARVLDVSHGELIGSIRERHIAQRRWLVMLYMRDVRGYALPRVGKTFNRDHTTALHGLKRCRELLDKDSDYRALNAALREALA
jgi:chromosomal replication initiation ATPase DnaA